MNSFLEQYQLGFLLHTFERKYIYIYDYMTIISLNLQIVRYTVLLLKLNLKYGRFILVFDLHIFIKVCLNFI